MVLYELVCVAAVSNSSAPFRDLIRSTSRLVINNGGVVRGLQYWGKRWLPQRTRRHQTYHEQGDYFLIHFDTSPPIMNQLNTRLRADPRVVKWTALKLGDRLDQITPKNTAGGIHDIFAKQGGGNTAYPAVEHTGRSVLGGGSTIS